MSFTIMHLLLRGATDTTIRSSSMLTHTHTHPHTRKRLLRCAPQGWGGPPCHAFLGPLVIPGITSIPGISFTPGTPCHSWDHFRSYSWDPLPFLGPPAIPEAACRSWDLAIPGTPAIPRTISHFWLPCHFWDPQPFCEWPLAVGQPQKQHRERGRLAFRFALMRFFFFAEMGIPPRSSVAILWPLPILGPSAIPATPCFVFKTYFKLP